MRINRLDLIAYGSFTGRSLNLSEGDYGLHLIYGDNEAGKSTSLRALIALLFGVPARTTDNYLHMNNQLRIGGKLGLSDGREIEFIRRKGSKGTLLDIDNAVLDDNVLYPFLPGGIDENLFTKLYGIDHGGLVSGGKELLSQSGDLGQALFSAAVGTAGFRQILADLQAGADELFSGRASKKIVNQAIADYKEAQKRIKESSIPVADWLKLKNQLAETQAAIVSVEKEIDAKSKIKSRLDRLNRVKGALAERRVIMSRINDLGEVLLLSEDFDEKRKIAINNLQKAAELKARAENKLKNLKDEAASLNVRSELLVNEDMIMAIHRELGAVETAIKDRPQQDGKRRMLRNEAEQLLKAVRPDIGIDDSDQLRPLINNKKWMAGLAHKYSLLNQKKEKAEVSLADLLEEQLQIKNKLEEAGESAIDLSELKATVSAVRKAGNLEQRLAELKKRETDALKTCENEFARLGRFSGSIEKISNSAMPDPETLDIFERQFDELSEHLRDYARREKEIIEDQIQTAQALKSLILTSDVPSIADLKEVRSGRDEGWTHIKNNYIEHKVADEKIKELTADSDLISFYEQKVVEADSVADRLRLAADHVMKRIDLEEKLENLKSRQTDINKEVVRLQEDKENLENDWKSIWQLKEISPGTPREMKQWLVRLDKLIEHVRAADLLDLEVEQLEKEYSGQRDSVLLQIKQFEKRVNFAEMTLEALINICEQRIDYEETALKQKMKFEHSLEGAKIRIARLQEELASYKIDKANWQKEWEQAIEGLGLKSDIHPELATETFEHLLNFFDKFDRSEELRRRIYGIDQVEDQFRRKVLNFAQGLSYETGDRDPVIIAVQLHRDLNEAREARASLKKLQDQEKSIVDDLGESKITIQTAHDQLAALLEQAGVQEIEELEASAESSGKLRHLQLKLEGLEQELLRNGDGHGLEELEQEDRAADTDTIDSERERVFNELKDLQAERDNLRDQKQNIKNQIKSMDGRGEAAKASEESAQHLSLIISGSEQYLRLKIAALILEQRIEEYRKSNQAPVLARAADIFSKLTLGAYGGLRDELDNNGRPILLGLRSNDFEVPVDGMSDGTRDQLFLALRLAALEQHLSKGEPFPVIVDDILIGFDDGRTKVCLEVLTELALSTQVLLFTHHRRVVEIAESLKAKAGIYSHVLN